VHAASISAPASAAPVLPTTDPHWVPHGELSAADRFFLARIRNERDLIFPRNALRISLIIPPLALLIFLVPSWLSFVLALPYIAFVFTQFTGRYVLMLHATCHRPLFKREYNAWNKWIPWVLGPFFGLTPTSFFAHHVGMHHPENNLEHDLSSTMGYKRDDFGHFLHYWARFFFTNYFHLPRYFLQRNRRQLAQDFVLGELSWMVGATALMFVDWAGTLVVFVLPLLLIRFLMMCGNWGQHAFVDVNDAGNAYRNSTCLTNTRYNHKAYNDGYHIVHHIKPNLHWAEMAEWYEQNIAEFGRNDAIVFSGIADNQAVFWNLMRGRYEHLARHLVDLPGAPVRTLDEKVAWLKQRVQTPGYARKGLLEPRETPWGAEPAKG
jgi:fatty acid desaturase